MLLQPITVPFSKSTLKPSVYTLTDQLSSTFIFKPFVHCQKLSAGIFLSKQ